MADVLPYLPEDGPSLPERWDALKTSPVGRAVGAAANAGDAINGAIQHPIDTAARVIAPAANALTGNAFSSSGPLSGPAPNFDGPNGPTYVPPPATGPQQSPAPGTQQAGAPPPQQAPAPPPPPLTPDHPVVKQLAAVGENAINVNGSIDWEVMKNHLAQVGLDNENKARLLANIDAAQKHVQAAQAIGRQAAYDQSGRKYWEDESTGGKILRVIEGVFTLGGSEAYIGSAIKRQVAADQKNLDAENNTYAAVLDLTKSKEAAASADYVKQGHLFQLGLDRIKMKYPKMSDDQRGTIAALQTGIEKETSLAMLQNIKQAQDNSVAGKHVGIAQQGANTAGFNAQTERMKASADIAGKKNPNKETIVRDTSGNVIGNTDTADEAKQVQAQQLSVEGLDRLAAKVKSYSWLDKFTPSARAAASADYSQAMQLVNMYRASKPNEESSRQMEVLQKSIPNPNDLTTSPAAYRTAFNELLGQMKISLSKAKKQSGL